MSNEKNLESILAITFGFLVLYLIFDIQAFLIVSFIISGIGLFSKYLSGKVAQAWLKFALVLGTINGKIILSLIFFLILTPMALIRRLFTKPVVKLKKEEVTMYTLRNHTYTGADIENVW
jgi:hypothetical protein